MIAPRVKSVAPTTARSWVTRRDRSHCAGARRLVGFLVFGGMPMFMKMPCEGVETLIMHAGAGGRFRGALGRLGVDGRRATAAGHAVVTGTPTAALD